MDDLKSLAQARLNKARLLAVAHGMAADTADSRNKRLGVPVIVLTTIVGTSAFASLTDLGKSQVAIALATGALSILAAAMAAVQTFFNFAASAHSHAKASVQFQALGNAIEHAMLQNPFDMHQLLQKLDEEFTKTQQEAPRVSRDCQQRAAKDLLKSAAPSAAAKVGDLRTIDFGSLIAKLDLDTTRFLGPRA